MTNNICPETIIIDFDSIWCTLPKGHDGMHLDFNDFYWMPKR